MLRFLAPLVGAIALSSLASANTPANPGGGQRLNTWTQMYCDPQVCNCTSNPVSQKLCYSSQFGVEIGSEIVSVKTGFSSTECLTATIPPASCAQICYTYRVVQRCGWWGCTYETSLLRTTVFESPASCSPPSAPGTRPLRISLAP